MHIHSFHSFSHISPNQSHAHTHTHETHKFTMDQAQACDLHVRNEKQNFTIAIDNRARVVFIALLIITINLVCFFFHYLSTTLHQEMLSRSSLETQKLELMSAMSELKLQQAALERENLELRATHLNNNTLPADRQPIIAAGRIRTNSTSALHNSQNNILSTSGTIPKVRRMHSLLHIQ